MKKLSVVSLNLRFIRIPLLLLFSSIVFISYSLLRSIPPINLDIKTTAFLLSVQNSIHSPPNHIKTFSLVQTQKISKDKTVSVSKVNQSSTISRAVPLINKPAAAPGEKVEISNLTSLSLDTESYSKAPEFLTKDFSVLILHTHTTESYTPSSKFTYKPTDTDRTTDENYNVVRIGKHIESVLRKNGIKVYHDTSVNDYPGYNGSYNRSYKVAQNQLKKNPDIKIILDIHRDAIEGKNGEKIKYTCTVNSQNAAKLMFVVGSNQSGLSHESWGENMKFAYTLQQYINSVYPGLMRPINFRSQRFNQQLAPGAIIVEVGTNGNTMDEAILGAECFAECLTDYINTQKRM